MQNHEKIKSIEDRLDQVSTNLKKYEGYINSLRLELATLKFTTEIEETPTIVADAIVPVITSVPEPVQTNPNPVRESPKTFSKPSGVSLEEYVGGNLLSKVGVVVLVLGIGIFVKYAIDNNLISELGRIIIGYMAGFGLLITAYKLESKYHTYSAVILSGAMAVMYFTTFSANYYYQIFPRELAFGIMALITIITVWQATRYQVEWIAIFGLVGAYAIPFLLDDHTGAVEKLFLYMTIINTGVMWLAFRQKWVWMNAVAFFFTWLIYSAWFASDYTPEKHKTIALIFLFVFFLMNYINQIIYMFKEDFALNKFYVIRLVVNNFLFFSFGLAITQDFGDNYRGPFLLLNALIHGVVCWLMYRKKMGNNWLYYLIESFAWLAIIVFIPIQFDGNSITLSWVLGAATMYYFGRTKNISYYQNLAFVLLTLALFSLFKDWREYHSVAPPFLKTILNSTFLTTSIFVLATGFILRTNLDERYRPNPVPDIQKILTWGVALTLIGTFYMLWANEIAYWFVKQEVLAANARHFTTETLFEHYKNTWLIIYSVLFGAGLVWIVKSRLIHNITLVQITLAISGLAVFLWLSNADLSDLKEDYLSDISVASGWAIGVRYIAYAAFALLIWTNFKLVQEAKPPLEKLQKYFPLMIHGFILIVLSTELATWTEILNHGKMDSKIHQITQTGFSLLWGVYGFILVLIGFNQKIKIFRFAGIALFGVVVVKLFLFDLNNTSPLGKIIAFISLGLLLLILSFLYQKLKDKILEDDVE
jgi:uncharacterized membrane protein